MIFSAKAISIGALLSAVPVYAASYSQTKVYDSTNFFEGFNFTSDPDPSGGFVDYVDAETAKSSGMAKITNGAVYLGANYKDKSPNGRPSTRVRSKDVFTTGLFVADIAHMPAGTGKGASCGIWPAYWTSGPDWPNSGEIDIIEGVDNQKSNAITLHTAKGCNMDVTGSESTADQTSADCEDSDAGCSQGTTSANNYGAPFNANGGGVYVTEWASASISVWFFPRGSAKANAVINAGTADLDVKSFGPALASFSGNTCNIAERFKENYIIFNTNFCGSWASREYLKDEKCTSVAPTCNEWVANNPTAFNEAYWLVNSVKVYTRNN
ncbi:Concanavalin A-like lectin/glucanase, subgroup [Penicillium griseofulvum]|uniref:Concanavalin A-like lectin/glucanase, subgroup n=1 Tax=Penicillium patulum TaxID=5078 RepID=A0A135LAK1_PENPA|nr:Concanavalin A-like lectin/glucanase, subgroup [Penicillium griseofulvum]KXG45964.1 Concanavalin A-like lectin/glucanase, subgroup [Penicillium griseofulvum]